MAATLLGIDRATFLLGLHRYGVAAIALKENELMEDLHNA